MSCSANQRATVKLFVDDIEDKNIPQVLINFSHATIELFQKHVMTLVRLHPKEPLYDCESIQINDREVDQEYLKSILASITRDILAGKKTAKIKLIVSLEILLSLQQSKMRLYLIIPL